jgi:hypothetical protein
MRFLLLASIGLAACAPATQNPPPAGSQVTVGDDGTQIEMTAAAIKTYVVGGDYKSWIAEPAVHDRTQNSPHVRVRVFFNATSAATLRATAASFPSGAMIVKELYQADRVTLSGYAAMVKMDARWVWWEAFAGNLDSPAAFGIDHSTCVGCHSGGRDSVRSPLP